MPNPCKLVAYLRVSTEKQGRSGLGLEAQQAAVDAHVASTGCRLVGTYTEVETGKRDSLDNRPELRRAIAHAKRAKATLVVAKLDRLTRSVAVTSMLHTSGVEFIACDNPGANRMTIQILAVVAENEARMISERTKAALAAYKARGGQLGAALVQCRNLTPQARERGAAAAAAARTRNAAAAYADVAPFIAELRRSGLSLRAIARRLDAEGYATRADRPWNPVLVSRILTAP
ncbi:MAG: recombinase family protein [Vulcanimicrobiaceae bacterium]